MSAVGAGPPPGLLASGLSHSHHVSLGPGGLTDMYSSCCCHRGLFLQQAGHRHLLLANLGKHARFFGPYRNFKAVEGGDWWRWFCVYILMWFPKGLMNRRLSESEQKTGQTFIWSREGELVLCEVSADIVGLGPALEAGPRGEREQYVVSSLAKLWGEGLRVEGKSYPFAIGEWGPLERWGLIFSSFQGVC